MIGIHAEGDALQAARLANVAGALVVRKLGTATVSPAELLAELRRGPMAPATLLAPRGKVTALRAARERP